MGFRYSLLMAHDALYRGFDQFQWKKAGDILHVVVGLVLVLVGIFAY